MKTAKRDVYALITDRILNRLEAGIVPWQKPWAGGNQSPRNLISRKKYRGVNTFLLHAMCYASPYWVTFKQAKELGGNVRKGEKATPVVFWNWIEREDKDGKPQKIPFLRYYSAFNVDQCDGLESALPAPTEEQRTPDPILSAEEILKSMSDCPPIAHGGGRAAYIPAEDRIVIPHAGTFRSDEEYYSTLFHELTHATGHTSRLNRKGLNDSEAGEWSAFGSTPYAQEELVAEMGAAFLCGQVGIVERTLDNSAAYIQGWLKRLRDDQRLVVQAAAQAQKAADYILGPESEQEA